MVGICIAVAAILSYMVEVGAHGLVPVIDEAIGWNGVFPQKNMLSRWMILGIAAITCSLFASRRNRLFKLGLIVAFVGLVVLSHSAGGLMISLVLLAVVLMITQLKRRWNLLIPLLGFAGALTTFALLWISWHSDDLLALLGKDKTLTGRTQIWALSALAIVKQPLLGYGYSAFWRVDKESTTLSAMMHWDIPHSHSGYVDMILELGFIGLVLLLFVFVKTFITSVRRYRTTRNMEYVWPMVLICYLMTYSVLESVVMKANNLSWIAFIAASYSLERRESTGDVPSELLDEGLSTACQTPTASSA
jgi:O-antigen ligase